MSVTNVRAPSGRFMNEHRLSKFEKNTNFSMLKLDDKYRARQEYCRVLGWELVESENGSYFYNDNTNQRADIYVQPLSNGEKVYIPVSDEPEVTLAYNVVISGSGNFCTLRPNEWTLMGQLYRKKNNNRKR